MSHQTAQERPGVMPSGIVVELFPSSAADEGPGSKVAQGKPPSEKLARACNTAIMAIIALPLLLAIAALLRRLMGS
ncbi:hypothetical protein [Sphingopyxis sp. JAI108]|uniref:hypothetical protein n=1 Tax=Sphingopyxis sp. JAI108 TaxID=2723060 RepID=UPI0015CB6156|nr:hypothetical protein [Sphingopyxis sp. JAI108]NYF32547.1 hypothetical protein [Sphingopyxis sp. JAI108]